MRSTVLFLLPFLSACPTPKEPFITTDPDTGSGCETLLEDGLGVVFSRSSWESGLWSVEVDLGGSVVTCEATLPSSSPLGVCDDEGIELRLLAMTQSQYQGLFALWVSSTTLSSVSVDVRLDGVLVGSGSWTPVYEPVTECGQEFSIAEVELAF